MPRVTCIFRIHTSLLGKWHIPRNPTRKHCITTLSHAEIFGKIMGIYKNFGNASNPLLRNFIQKGFMTILENLWQSSETFGKLRKQFKIVFQCFYDFLKLSENLQKSSKVFGNLRKFSENFKNGSKVICRCFYDFLNFRRIFGNLRKCSENFWKFPDVIVNVRTGSQELKSFGAGFWEVLK